MVGYTPKNAIESAKQKEVKRRGNIYGEFSSVENITHAIITSPSRNKKKPRRLAKTVEEQAKEIHALLVSDSFRPSPSYTVTIHDPKERLLTILPETPDKIVHRALLNVLRPIWDKVFISACYCGVKRRGQLPAAKKVLDFLQEARQSGPVYCLKFDIRKYYPSIDHGVMKEIVRRSIKDKRILKILDDIIDSEPGIMLGSPLSPYFANLYITPLCHWLKEKKGVKYLIDYADDFVILSNNKEELHRLLAEIEDYTTNKLKIEVKRNKQIFPVALDRSDKHGRGIDFLGFVFNLNETRIRKGIKRNLCRKLAKLRKAKHPVPEKEFLQALASWWGWLKYSDSDYFINKLNKKSPYEIKFRR